MKILVSIGLSVILLFSSLGSQGFTYAKSKTEKKDAAEQMKSAFVIEKETGKVLFTKDSNKELPPASMTKIMTLLLIFKGLDRHDFSLKDKVSVSEHAASMGGSQVFLEPGETMTVDEMLKAITIASANDASVAMAEYIAGSEKDFVNRMNKEAKKLGLKHTHFKNPTGLPVDGHYSSAHDMAIMAKALLDHEKVLGYTSRYEDYLREDTENKFWLVNTNKLIKTYPGVDGLKTGFTNEAKYCLTATATRNNMRIIAVVMGAQTPKDRNKKMAQLLDQAFANYKTKKLINKNHTVKIVNISKSEKQNVPVVTQKPVVLLLKKSDSGKNVKKRMVIKKHLQAPLKAGTVVGYYELRKNNKVLAKTPLVINQDIKEASWWQLFKQSMGKIVH
ncbi:D-alanyl-D-alanine carboxypeptidase family protein [Terrilactibacillus laevilacticus]|uniref:serine-type D-Ala-D-Ala carboxypeptidase n=1 Tax=Terrilactibacillus laevilacticus TaxID=1380157 RepID=A0ABW5PS55_9BACI|nr:D-alanyl-D-alanine carboxypeptidase family protein [Terrilactibacillus laevilacticus]